MRISDHLPSLNLVPRAYRAYSVGRIASERPLTRSDGYFGTNWAGGEIWLNHEKEKVTGRVCISIHDHKIAILFTLFFSPSD